MDNTITITTTEYKEMLKRSIIFDMLKAEAEAGNIFTAKDFRRYFDIAEQNEEDDF